MSAALARRGLAVVALIASCLSGGGGAWAGGHPVSAAPSRAAVEAALRHRLDRAYLSYQWVVCVKMDRLYRRARIWRCNVDFGDPHIVQYCVILNRHGLITDRENHALNCAPSHRSSPRVGS